ncbi:MAG TPA: hypothetical protein VHU40_17370 [Polyangia bacterium]|nr:hypothetical protein [Polyangia bacterium]
MNARSSARLLEQSLATFRGQLTVADAAARTGLPTRDAQEGLALLAADRGGHLAVTSKGELLYDFTRGLVRDDRSGLLHRAGRALAKAALGVGRMIVRAWISVVMVGYALVFAGVLLALAVKDDSDGVGDILGLVARVIFESIYWTLHPFSPVFVAREPQWVLRRGRRRSSLAAPLYERVNRFVFGPPPPVVDPLQDSKNALAEIRRLKGRVVPADIMRVTGGSREAVERLLLRLVAEHQGDIQVSDEGAIVYEFPALRTTTGADAQAAADTAVVWSRLGEVPPLTGNSRAFNFAFVGVNGFNLAGGSIGLGMGLTLERLGAMLSQAGTVDPPPLPPVDGVPLALGLVPFLFSTALFVVPLLRRLGRPALEARVSHDNHVRLLLKHLLAARPDRFRFGVTELGAALTIGSRAATQDDVERAVKTLGGSVELAEDGAIEYAFDELARERAAVRAARALASPDEAAPGAIELSSADPGHGIREP